MVFVLSYPLIRVFDYSTFREILPQLPDTYWKWKSDLERKKAKECIPYVAAGCSFEEHDVQVSVSSFLAYCEEMHEPPTVSMLYRFASEKRG